MIEGGLLSLQLGRALIRCLDPLNQGDAFEGQTGSPTLSERTDGQSDDPDAFWRPGFASGKPAPRTAGGSGGMRVVNDVLGRSAHPYERAKAAGDFAMRKYLRDMPIPAHDANVFARLKAAVSRG
jgi:hypothetical protein